MHFGHYKNNFRNLWVVFIVLLLAACKTKPALIISFKTPEQGQNINLGDEVNISLDIPKGVQVESTNYLIDGKPIGETRKGNALKLATKDLAMGYRMITAIVAHDGNKDTITTNIVLKSNLVPKNLSYKIIRTFPHDTSAYTEGLSYVNGKILESTGEKGNSVLKWVDLETGKTLQQTKLEPQYFGEGSLKIGDKIIMLTWQENIGFIFDAKTFKQLGTFPYQNSREGWGLTFNGQQILRSDGSNRIWLMNKDTYREEGYIEVYDQNGEVKNLNELEFINGKIYANAYLANKIVVIDPVSGRVEATINLSPLVPKNYFKTDFEEQNNVLNGIAWDEKGKRLFVGGKKWPKLYEIKITN
ncbi:MAG: glutaminyl-peptide cyclotransferase [Bacteroidota bacterium]